MPSTSTFNNYTLNLPGGNPPWGVIENQLFQDILGYMPNKNLYITERHHHSSLWDPAVDTEVGSEIVRTTAAGMRVQLGGVGGAPLTALDVRGTPATITPPALDGGTVGLFARDGGANVSLIAATNSTSSLYFGNTTREAEMTIQLNGTDVAGIHLMRTVEIMRYTRLGGTVFNDGAADIDVRMESQTLPNMFFLDGGNARITMGTNTEPTGGYSGATRLAIQSGNAVELTLITEDTTQCHINFGDAADEDVGEIVFNHQAGANEFNINVGGTNYLVFDESGLRVANQATVHAVSQNGAPTSTTAGALWHDADAGGANGTLMCYSNGAWRVVQAL